MTPPPFGALVTNLLAEPGSARRRGYFVRVFQVKGRNRSLPPGRYWELTDGAGTFWLVHPTVGGLALDPPRDHVVEVDSATALAPLRRPARSRS